MQSFPLLNSSLCENLIYDTFHEQSKLLPHFLLVFMHRMLQMEQQKQGNNSLVTLFLYGEKAWGEDSKLFLTQQQHSPVWALFLPTTAMWLWGTPMCNKYYQANPCLILHQTMFYIVRGLGLSWPQRNKDFEELFIRFSCSRPFVLSQLCCVLQIILENYSVEWDITISNDFICFICLAVISCTTQGNKCENI